MWYFNAHYKDEETATEGWNHLLKVTQLESDGARIQIQAIWLRNLHA